MRRERRRSRLTLTAGALVAVAALAAGACAGDGSPEDARPRFERVEPASAPAAVQVVIPPGTAARSAQGLPTDAVPGTIEMGRGDRIELRNDDVEPAFVGPFYVPAGTTVAYEATGAGSMDSVCNAQEDGLVTIVVSS